MHANSSSVASIIDAPRPAPRTFLRALALGTTLGASLAAVSCGPPPAAPPDAPGYMVVASMRGGYCVCCPSGDWSGNCYTSPMSPPDAGGPGPAQTPPTGQRWCTSADLVGEAGTIGPGCPIAGPMAPPEIV